MWREFGWSHFAPAEGVFQQRFGNHIRVLPSPREQVCGRLAGENRRGPPMLATPTGHFAASLTTTGGSA